MTTTNNIDNDNDVVEIVPAKYQSASLRFREVWMEYVDKEEEAKYEIVNMIKILQAEGFTRTRAIERIVEDHKDLKGFSRRTIYRELPGEMKQINSLRDLKQINNDTEEQTYQQDAYKDLDVPNGTNEIINTTSKTFEVKNTQIDDE